MPKPRKPPEPETYCDDCGKHRANVSVFAYGSVIHLCQACYVVFCPSYAGKS
jgi:hypothetical protein